MILWRSIMAGVLLLTQVGIMEGKMAVLDQHSKEDGVVYSIVTRNRNPRVHPGGKIEVEVFLSGHGVPEKNKLFVQMSSPYILNQNNVGVVISSIGCASNNVTGELRPVSGGQHVQTRELTPTTLIAILNKGYFLEIPVEVAGKPSNDWEIGRVMSEYLWDGHPPLLLSINTAKEAPPGDYEITFTFTYGNSQNLLQDYKAVQFHITSWWERHQALIAGIGLFIALASLVLTAVKTLLTTAPKQ